MLLDLSSRSSHPRISQSEIAFSELTGIHAKTTMESLMKGKVKFTDDARGFGFIRGDDGNDYYFKTREVYNEKSLWKGAFVNFSYEEGSKGRIAKNIESYTPNISDEGYFQTIRHKDKAVTAARLFTRDHYGVADAFKPIKGLGFVYNLKTIIVNLFFRLVAMILTAIWVPYLIFVVFPNFFFSDLDFMGMTKEWFHLVLFELPVLIWKYFFGA